jgi:hypothetical protein
LFELIHGIARPLEYLSRPLRGSAAGVILVFSVLLTLSARGGLFGIPLGLILMSWFFKYAYILFDHIVWGFKESPHLDIQLLNPLDEQRPLGQCLILGLGAMAVGGAWTSIGPAAGAVLGAVGMLLVPASVSATVIAERGLALGSEDEAEEVGRTPRTARRPRARGPDGSRPKGVEQGR